MKAEIENQIANLETVREMVDGYADIEDIDGETGRPIANKAMRAVSMIDEIIRDLEKLTRMEEDEGCEICGKPVAPSWNVLGHTCGGKP